MQKTLIIIKGTHCASCKTLIEDACKDIPGVILCAVDFQTGQTLVEHDDKLDWNVFKKEVESLGQYKVENV